MLKATIQIVLALVNHFPLFALTLRLKDPSRLPGHNINISSALSIGPDPFYAGGIVIIPNFKRKESYLDGLMLKVCGISMSMI